MLITNGENVKIVQELMRHANCRSTLEIYSQARTQAKREAQHRVVEMIFPQDQRPAERQSLPCRFDPTLNGAFWSLGPLD
jgi:hypothetical protein